VTDPQTGQAWARGARAGSADDFSRLVRLHQQPLRAFLRRLSGNAAEADDLAQDSFVFAWEHIARFDPALHWHGWREKAIAPVRLAWSPTLAWCIPFGAMFLLGLSFISRGTGGFVYASY